MKMERINGDTRDRERVMRTLEKSDTPILTGMQIYTTSSDPTKGYGTPAQAAGIKVQGKDKWLTII
jgi:hypothetical protein